MKQAIESRRKEIYLFLKSVKTLENLNPNQIKMLANSSKVIIQG